MSPALGAAQGSSFISLRRASGVLGFVTRGRTTIEQPGRIGSGRRGALRSEVKEEVSAKPRPGDIRGAECAVDLIPRSVSQTVSIGSNGPKADNCIGAMDRGSA